LNPDRGIGYPIQMKTSGGIQRKNKRVLLLNGVIQKLPPSKHTKKKGEQGGHFQEVKGGEEIT